MTILDKLYYDLQTYEPQMTDIQTTTDDSSNGNFFSKLTSVLKLSSTTNKKEFLDRPKSLYIYGGAGCGKVAIADSLTFSSMIDDVRHRVF